MTTDSVESRISSLNSHSGVPLPFECFFAAELDSCSRIERILHQLFSEIRINPKREFFRVDPEKVVLAISIGSFKDVTPGSVIADSDDQEALKKEKARRPRIKLSALAIHPGQILTFSRDESISAEVTSDNKIIYKGQVTSLSAAALDALHSLGYKTPAASGSEWRQSNLMSLNRRAPNIAFKPKLHRYAVNMAEEACHVASYALQFGLT